MLPLRFLLILAAAPASLFAWQGKVFQVAGKKITVASMQTSGLKGGRRLYIVKKGRDIGQGRVDGIYHTKVEMTLTAGAAEKGLVVTDQKPRGDVDRRTVNIYRDPASGFEIAFPPDWKTHTPEPDNPSTVQLLSADGSASIVINPFTLFGNNTAADFANMYASRSGLGEPIRTGQVDEEAQAFGAEAGFEGVYIWQNKPTVVTIYTAQTKAYLVQFRNYIHTHPRFSKRNHDDAYMILNSLKIGKIRTKQEAIEKKEGGIKDVQ